MAYALIDPKCDVSRISSWTHEAARNIHKPELELLEGKHNITQIEDNTFEVASPLHWVECNASVTCDDYYYDPSDSTIKAKNNVAEPVSEAPEEPA